MLHIRQLKIGFPWLHLVKWYLNLLRQKEYMFNKTVSRVILMFTDIEGMQMISYTTQHCSSFLLGIKAVKEVCVWSIEKDQIGRKSHFEQKCLRSLHVWGKRTKYIKTWKMEFTLFFVWSLFVFPYDKYLSVSMLWYVTELTVRVPILLYGFLGKIFLLYIYIFSFKN